jgi:hypothetical protein
MPGQIVTKGIDRGRYAIDTWKMNIREHHDAQLSRLFMVHGRGRATPIE